MSKREMRARLAALSFTEKIRILEKLRNRSLAFAASGMRPKIAETPGQAEDEKQRLRKEEK